MATGTGIWEGLALSLANENEIIQQTAATDILTISGASGQTGDFLVFRNSSSTEQFAINSDGAIEEMKCAAIGTLDFSASDTTSATFAVAGLTTDDVAIISPTEATDGALAVDQVAAGTLSVRNNTCEEADVEFNYLVISLA